MNFGAILTAMVTPFDADNRVDEAAAARLLHHLFEHGSDGVVVCGTTGEAATLDDDEHLAFIEFVVNEMRASHPGKTVIAGVGSNDTRHGVELTRRPRRWSPTRCSRSTRTTTARPGAVSSRHFEAINDATDLPIVLYNIPQRTGSDMPNDLLAELAELENIVP